MQKPKSINTFSKITAASAVEDFKDVTLLKVIPGEKVETNPVESKDVLPLIKQGFKVLPCDKKAPISRIKSVNKIRSSPINEQNCGFYFPAPQIAILTGQEIEAIDVDSKNDLTNNLKKQLLTAIKYALPDVYDKSIIEETPTGGIHIIYKCKKIGGNQEFAKRLATSEEKQKGKRVMTLIESRGEGGYIVCCPSPGYKQIKRGLSDIEFISIEERDQLISICKSFDQLHEFELPGLSKKQSNSPEAPWHIFNQQHDHTWMADTLKGIGWAIVKEDADRIYVLRPGSKAKTSGAIWKASNILYLFSSNSEFEAQKPISAFSIYCTLSFDGDIKNCARVLSEQGCGTWKAEESEFFNVTVKGKIDIKLSAIVEWLNDIGIRKHWYSQKDFEIVQVTDNIVQVVTLDYLKKIFGSYIKETVPEKVYNVLLASIRSIFLKEGIISQVQDLDESKFIKSDARTGWVFFSNGVLKVTDFNNELLAYSSLEGYVWARNIVQREFKVGESAGDVSDFINVISGKRLDKEQTFICAIGYLLHGYKDPTNPKVVILNDEYYDDSGSEPEGGTGKGLFIILFKHFKNVYSVDGKSFKFDKNFVFQGVSGDTELFAIEDAAKGFDFERMFSVVTEGMTVEKKGKDEFQIPYEKSPKILITSNYAIKGSSSSHLRRRYELEIAPFFSHKYSPIDYFKHRLFIDWSREEWSRFDNYMVNCLQTFLSKGLPAEVNVNLKKKKLIQETNRDFYHWITSVHEIGLPVKVSKEQMKSKFCETYPDYWNRISTAKFSQWLIRWGRDYGVQVDSSNKYNGQMSYQFSGILKSGEGTGNIADQWDDIM